MSRRPQISIVIPCYNQAAYLVDCLSSVREQTFTDWEVIVVDDGSDDAARIADCVRDPGDPRIRLLRHEQNRGLGAARNTGFKSSRADLILPLDSDDCLSPPYLSETAGALLSQPEADCVFSDFQLFEESDDIWSWGNGSPRDMLFRQWIPGTGVLMRKRLWERVGGYVELPQPFCGNEDWDFWIGAVRLGIQPIHIPKPLYLYRRTSASMSVSTLRYHDHTTRKFIYDRYREFFDTHKAGSNFLAEGYLRSSRKSLDLDHKVRGAILAGRGLTIAPLNRYLWRQLVRGLTPSIVLRTRRHLAESGVKLLYKFAIGRKVFWDQKAPGVHDQYGTLTHDHECLKQVLTSAGARRVLDVGCGSGRLFPLYESLGLTEVVAQDVSRQALRIARQRSLNGIRLLHSPVHHLRYPRFYFDVAICNRVLQHIPPHSVEAAIKAICKVARFVYVNELADCDGESPTPVMFMHDYVHLFQRFGFAVEESGFVLSEKNTQQQWRLFGCRAVDHERDRTLGNRRSGQERRTEKTFADIV